MEAFEMQWDRIEEKMMPKLFELLKAETK
jgi:hypothetical protein